MMRRYFFLKKNLIKFNKKTYKIDKKNWKNEMKSKIFFI